MTNLQVILYSTPQLLKSSANPNKLFECKTKLNIINYIVMVYCVNLLNNNPLVIEVLYYKYTKI